MISNKLTLNLSKSNLMIVPPKKLLPEKCTLSLDFSQITVCKTVKYLEVTIDDSLNFDAHIRLLENKLARSFGMLFKTKQYLNTSTLVQLYYSTFHAYLSYGLIIWGSTFKSYLNKLASLQNKAVKIICNRRWVDHVSVFYKNLRILKLTDLFRLELATFMYKAKKKTIPRAFQSFFKKVTEVYERTTRASTSSELFSPYCKTLTLQRSIKYQGALLWNLLRLEIQNSFSVKVFRLKYKNYLLNLY